MEDLSELTAVIRRASEDFEDATGAYAVWNTTEAVYGTREMAEAEFYQWAALRVIAHLSTNSEQRAEAERRLEAIREKHAGCRR